MEKHNICNNEQYICKNNTIALVVALGGLPKEIVVENQTLHLKPSLHVSLVCMADIIEKNNITTANFKDKIIADFCEFVDENPINLIGYSHEYRFAAEGDLRSVVVMCDVSNLGAFFARINEKYSLHIEVPPTHVTLYTVEGKAGIYLTDEKDLEEKTKLVKVPELFGKM